VRFREDWLAAVLRVPYVPTLRAVHPAAATAATFDAVMSVAGTGRFLPCDPHARWYEVKDEEILVGEVVHEPALTVIPALSTRGGGVLDVYWYAQEPPAMDWVTRRAAGWRAVCGASTARVTWFQDHPQGARFRVLLKTFGPVDHRPRAPRVTELRESTAAATWPAFAQELAHEGLAFLDERLTAGTVTGPVLACAEDGQIVGVAGPQNVMTDAAGQPFAASQYFIVHPGRRRQGYGKALWQAAMSWQQASGAMFKLIQVSLADPPAEQFYLAQGLASLGYICRQDITKRTC
jgi:GNAT superfamily N-acetyltransferase